MPGNGRQVRPSPGVLRSCCQYRWRGSSRIRTLSGRSRCRANEDEWGRDASSIFAAERQAVLSEYALRRRSWLSQQACVSKRADGAGATATASSEVRPSGLLRADWSDDTATLMFQADAIAGVFESKAATDSRISSSVGNWPMDVHDLHSTHSQMNPGKTNSKNSTGSRTTDIKL
jgi:hypothetical protein